MIRFRTVTLPIRSELKRCGYELMATSLAEENGLEYASRMAREGLVNRRGEAVQVP
jgi:hypothetical protein